MTNHVNITPEAWAANQSINTTSPSINQTASDVGDVIASAAAGSAEIGGMFALATFALILWKADVSTDVAAVVLIPLTITLASNGWLPLANSLIDGALLVAAGIFAYGLAKYMFR